MQDSNDAESVGQGSASEGSKEKNTFKKNFDAGVWTAIFTGVLMVFSGLLWRVSDRANETSIATQRAFLSYSGPVFIKDIQGGKLKGINVYYITSNSGTTPAGAAVSEWNMSFGAVLPQKGTDFDTLPQSERLSLVLGPKANFQAKPVYLSVADLELVADGKKHLFFWGWTTYRDIFSGTPERLSEFCTDITSATWGKPNHADPNVDFATVSPPCPIHNCYDQDCEDYNRRIQ